MLSKLLNALPNELSSSTLTQADESHSLIDIQTTLPSKFESLFSQLSSLDHHLRPSSAQSPGQASETNLRISSRAIAQVRSTWGTEPIEESAEAEHLTDVVDQGLRLTPDLAQNLQEPSQSIVLISAILPIDQVEGRQRRRPEDLSLSTQALNTVPFAVDQTRSKVVLSPNTFQADGRLTSPGQLASKMLSLTPKASASETDAWLTAQPLLAVLTPHSHPIELTTSVSLSLEKFDYAQDELFDSSPSRWGTPNLSPHNVASNNHVQSTLNQILGQSAAYPAPIKRDTTLPDTRLNNDSILGTATGLRTSDAHFQTPTSSHLVLSLDQDKELQGLTTNVASPTTHTIEKSAVQLAATDSSKHLAGYSVVANENAQLVSASESQLADSRLVNRPVQQTYPAVYAAALPLEPDINIALRPLIETKLISHLDTSDESGEQKELASARQDLAPSASAPAPLQAHISLPFDAERSAAIGARHAPASDHTDITQPTVNLASMAPFASPLPTIRQSTSSQKLFIAPTRPVHALEARPEPVSSIGRTPISFADLNGVSTQVFSSTSQLVNASEIQTVDRLLGNRTGQRTYNAVYATALPPEQDSTIAPKPPAEAKRMSQLDTLGESGGRVELASASQDVQPSASVRASLQANISFPFYAKNSAAIGTRPSPPSDHTKIPQPTVTLSLVPAPESHASGVRQSTSSQELPVALTRPIHDPETRPEQTPPLSQTTVSVADLTSMSPQISDVASNESVNDRFNSLWETLGEEIQSRSSEFRQSTSTTITLDLQTLGKLRIELNVGKDFSQATFVADELLLRQAIQEGLPKLRELLTRAGFTRSDIHITDSLNLMKGSQTQDTRSSTRTNELEATENKASGLYELSRSFRVRSIKGLQQKNES